MTHNKFVNQDVPNKVIAEIVRLVGQWEHLSRGRGLYATPREQRVRLRKLNAIENSIRDILLIDHSRTDLPLPDGRVVTFDANKDASGNITNWKMRI